MMQEEKIRKAFEKKGYGPNTYITQREYLNVLNSLTRGEPFSQEVADELWNQASGQRPSQQLRVSELCSIIVDAQNILKTRIAENNEQISSLEREKRRLQNNPSREQVRRIEQIQIQLEDLIEEKQSFENDYRYVTEPFGISMVASVYKNLNTNVHTDYHDNPINYHENPTPRSPENEELKILLYLSLAFGFIELIMIYDKYDFLNLIVLTCLLSIYFMSFFDKIYIRFTLGMIGVSIALDLVWLIMYAGQKWNPPSVGNNSIYEAGYLRFIVFFTAVLIPLKCGIAFFLFKHRDAGVDVKYDLSFGGMDFPLNANKSNPISQGITNQLPRTEN